VEKAASNQKVAVSFNSEKGKHMLRKSGIEVVGDVPWGAHFCLFYETKEDLIDVLAPCFKAGLENNEFCMWVTSEPLTEEEAKNAMRKVVPNFDRYLKRGQMEIVSHSKWYLKDGAFNLQRVLDGWIDKLNQALDKGYDGIRVTGNTAWLEKRDWKNFTDYEEKVNSAIGKHRIMAICTYSLARCGALEIVDVISNHQFALIRREGEWEIIESFERKQTEEALRESEENFRNIFENANDTMIFLDIYGRILNANKKAVEVFGGSKEELLGKHFTKVGVFSPRDTPQVLSAFAKVLAGKIGTLTVSIRNKRGKEIALECSGSATKIGDKLAVLVIGRDITERKRMEEVLRQSQEKYRNIVELAPDGIMTVNTKGFITSINPAFSTLTGYSKDEIVGKHFTKLPTIKMKDILKFVKLYRSFFRGKTIPLVEFVYRRKDGTIAWGEVHPSLMKEDGKIIGAQAILRDITDRKKTEEELIRLSSAVKMSADSIVIGDLDAKIIDVNEATLKMYGAEDKRDLIGRSSFDLIAPEDREKALAGMKEVLKKGYAKGWKYNIITKDGNRIPVEMNTAIMKGVDGKPIGFVAVSRDITERRKMENNLRESEEKYRSLFENARDVIFTGDLKGNITDINRFVEEYDFKRDEVVGKNMLKFVSKKYWPRLLKHLAKISQGNLVEGEIEIITPKGKIIAEYRSNPIRRGKKVVGFQTILRNITERKEMEEKLRQYSEHLEGLVQKRTEELLESEKRYSVLVEEASDGVVILQDEKIAFTNKKGAELIGYSKDELLGVPFEKLVSEKHRLITKKRYDERLRGEKLPETLEIELIAKTGEYIQIELTGALVDYQGRPADLIIIRDIRERKKLEEQHLKLEKLATMGELATMVAHDLRNPLTSIRNASYYIKNTCPHHAKPECKAALEMFDIIEQGTLFANNIINDLLDFAAKRPLQKEKQDINKIVDSSITISNIPENIKIERKFAKKAIATVDEKQLQRVFLNLTRNAVQAMPDGGKLTVKTSETKDHVEIEFRDTGIGMSEENMSKLFTPLFTTKAKGIGMGLAICKKIVEEHDGTIDFESKVGQGTTFTIKLPKKEEANNQ
jgi:PAS domain S-box-containing protein